jgi:hypothetical protein
MGLSMGLQCIVTSHMNPNLSGVAKFNRILAQKLQIPCIGFDQRLALQAGTMLLSVKVRDMTPADIQQARAFVTNMKQCPIDYDIMFHSFDSLEFEYELMESSRQIFCSNAEIFHCLQGTDKPLVNAWCPSLMDTSKLPIQERELNLFAFGMAHKIQVRYYKMLREFLDKHAVDYQLWVSTAFHEKANFGDFGSISTQLSSIFDSRIQFMGFLSDEAVNYFLRKAHVFVTFFEKGARANNTSVYAAMERGCAVLTNTDEYSPPWMRHKETILDIRHVTPDDFDPMLLNTISRKAQEMISTHASWEQLANLISGNGGLC